MKELQDAQFKKNKGRSIYLYDSLDFLTGCGFEVINPLICDDLEYVHLVFIDKYDKNTTLGLERIFNETLLKGEHNIYFEESIIGKRTKTYLDDFVKNNKLVDVTYFDGSKLFENYTIKNEVGKEFYKKIRTATFFADEDDVHYVVFDSKKNSLKDFTSKIDKFTSYLHLKQK